VCHSQSTYLHVSIKFFHSTQNITPFQKLTGVSGSLCKAQNRVTNLTETQEIKQVNKQGNTANICNKWTHKTLSEASNKGYGLFCITGAIL